MARPDSGTLWGAMGFRAFGGNRPLPSLQVDFIPVRQANLSRAGRRQHQELEGEFRGRVSVRLPHHLHRARDLRVRQRAHVLDYGLLSAKRLTEHIAGGVVRPKPHRHRPLHHRPDALAHPPGSHPLVVPDRCQHRQNVGCRYLANRSMAELWERIDAYAGDPVLRMPGAAPARPQLFQNTGGRLGERGHVPHLVPLGTRITARARNLAVHERRLARLGQRYQLVAPEPHRAGSALDP